MKTYKRNTSPVTVFEQMYNVCCLYQDDSVKTMKERVNIKVCNKIIRRYNRIADNIPDIKKVFMQPTNEIMVIEKNRFT